MTKRNIIIIMTLLSLLGIGALWFFTTFEQRQITRWQGYQDEAKKDDFYLAERFLQAKGIKVTREKMYTHLNRYTDLSGYDTLFFSNRGKLLSDNQIKLLLNWVDKGGNLVIDSQENYQTFLPKQTDPLTRANFDGFNLLSQAGIGVGRCVRGKNNHINCENRCKKITKKKNKKSAKKIKLLSDMTKSERLDELLTVPPAAGNNRYSTITVDGQVLQLRWSHYKNTIVAHKGKAKLLYAQPAKCSGELFANFAYGKGHIVVYQLVAFNFKNNRYEKQNSLLTDHNATYLYYLLNLGGRSKNILWFERDSYASAWSIMWRYGAFAVVTAILLVLVWAWKNARRFGPLLHVDTRDNRSLKRHLQATGQFYIKQGQQNKLLEHCYEQLARDIDRAIPLAANLSQPELIDILVAKTELPHTAIHRVLAKNYPSNDAEFTQLIDTINKMRKRL